MTVTAKIHRLDGRVEAQCEHGVGHPVRPRGSMIMLDGAHGVHGCDGCCQDTEFPTTEERLDRILREGQ